MTQQHKILDHETMIAQPTSGSVTVELAYQLVGEPAMPATSSNQADHRPIPDKQDVTLVWDEVMEDTLTRYADAWQRLADR